MREGRDARLAGVERELARVERELNESRERFHYRALSAHRPYTRYSLSFHCRGYTNAYGGVNNTHEIEMTLPAGYPVHDGPRFTARTPLYHPNLIGDWLCIGIDAQHQTWRPSIPISELILQVSRFIRHDSQGLTPIDNDRWVLAGGGPSSEYSGASAPPAAAPRILFRNRPALVASLPSVKLPSRKR
jgi:ubiquitin-protein ligase